MRLRHLLLVATALTPLATPAHAGPNGATVVGGSATVSGQGSANVTVNQFSDRAIINWRMFDIGVGERTTFVQPNSNSIALNRVTGNMGPSQILGSLNANGKVFVVNPDGIIFGAGAVINTAGFLATTSDIRNEDFMGGGSRFNFNIAGRPNASIVNMGSITATSGGFAALVAPGVRNSGTITASLGTIALGAGNVFTLDFYGDKLITLGVGDQIASQVKDVATGQPLSALVKNEGILRASGGRVELTAAAARHVVDSVINTSGVIEANSVGMRNGRIVLSAATADTKGNTPRQTVKVSGALSAAGIQKGTKGGTVVITGENIELAGAAIDASGRAGGGTVMVGGDWGGGKPNRNGVNNQSAALDANAVPNATTVSVDAATTIDASARDSGNGGKVVLWANDHLTFAGTIYALGGNEFGNGGFVETSGKNTLEASSGVVNAGRGGTWLLDPADLIVNTGLAASIQSSLQGGTNVTQQTATSGAGNGDIIFDSGVRIEWSTSATLTLIAFRNIQFNDGAFGTPTGNIVNTGAGNLVMRADSTGTGTGTLVMTPFTNPTRINWTNSTGTITLYYNPTTFGTQDNFTVGNGNIQVASSNQLQQYMLVNSVANLNAIGTNTTTLGGKYALGKDISYPAGPAFTPIGSGVGSFTGVFDGNGGLGINHTISNLTIAPTNPAIWNIGLFGVSAIGSEVRNLNLSNVSVTANPNVPIAPGPTGVQYVGPLVGQAAGTVTNVHVTSGSVNGVPGAWVVAGGLVGTANGTVDNSSSAAGVSVGSGGSTTLNYAGGLAGRADAGGDVLNSSASGNVTGGSLSHVGGLVGQSNNGSTISGSSASGTVTVGANGFVGGLVGTNSSGATINGNSSASGDVTGSGANIIAGGLAGQNFGSISNTSVTGGALNIGAFNGISAGGLVGRNTGTIATSQTAMSVTVGNSSTSTQNNHAGGAVGVNAGAISDTLATGDVSGGSNSFIGGLVGRNEVGGTITGSGAGPTYFSGATGNVTLTDTTGGGAGGFVGFNFGTISGFNFAGGTVTGGNGSDINHSGGIGGFVGLNDASGQISGSYAIGDVSAGLRNSVGGFAGFNNGTITGSTAGGAVSGPDNSVGGFVGFNGSSGNISSSFAVGNVSGAAFNLGGFVGDNMGTITGSGAIGTVTATGPSNNFDNAVGGFAGNNSGTISDSQAIGNVIGVGAAGGFAGNNDGTITNGFAFGNVSVGSNGVAGGFVGGNFGEIENSSAAGTVTGGANTYLGGFAAGNFGLINNSITFLTSTVTSTGPNAVAGGFAGLNLEAISNSTAGGAVNGTSNSYLGGFVGINAGLVQDSNASGNVAGSGASNYVGGFAGVNFGNIDPSTSSGNASSGATSIVGGFVGANAALQFPNGFQTVGVITAGSAGTGTATGGTGSMVGPQVGQNYPTAGLPDLPANSCQTQVGAICGGTLFNPNPSNPTPPNPTPDQPRRDIDVAIVPQLSPLLNIAAQFTNDTLTEKKPEEVIDTKQGTPGAAGGSGGPAGQKGGGGQSAGNAGRPPINVVPPPGLGPLPSGMPPLNETRFATNEVVMQLGLVLTPEQIDALQRQFGLEVISTQRFDLLGRTVFRFRITGGGDVRGTIGGIQGLLGARVSVQPSYGFELAQSAAPAPAAQNSGDSAQYIVAKLGLVEAHGIATGKNVKIAVIDSEIDSQHPDLAGVVKGSFDALPSSDQTPHPHGTGMAGAIGSHQRLLGIAPGANILGVRAFGVSDAGAQGTSMNIVKGLEWAVQQGAQVINMSFAGPRDPILEQAIKSLKDRGIILVAASGNAGPKSPPLFPGADANVIGVSATDVDDKTYKNAVRGKHVAIAAPGVDILVPAPAGGYQLTTGTSVAAAHISGVVALMLERNSRLTPNEIRAILSATAKKLPQGRNEIGAGLVDPVQALSKAGPKSAQAQ